MYQPQTNFIGDDGTDLGKKLVTKSYLIDVYPDLVTTTLGISPQLWVWGDGNLGQLGTVTSSRNRFTPVTTIAGGTNWADTATTEPEDLYTLSAGTSYTTAIKTDGTLWTWGLGTSGQLGTNNLTSISSPVTTFAGGTNWKQVSAGSTHTAAIKTDGTLWTWGLGTSGQLGNFSTTNRSTPVTTFAGGTNWKQVSAGTSYTTAIKTDGTLWTWGLATSGQLGNFFTTNRSTPITTFAGGTDWKQVSAGSTHTAAIKTDGTLWVWGAGTSGQLGNNILSNRSTPITTFAGGTDWKQVSTGSLFTTAIKTDGTLWTWGSGTSGQLGNFSTTIRSTPITTFAGGTDWKQVSSGSSHTTAIKTDGTLWTWGLGTSGQLGNNILSNRSTPVTTFAGGTDWKQVNAGNTHTIALRDDGVNKELFTWGLGSSGQLGVYDENSTLIPVTVFSRGFNWKQISAGENHAAAVKTDGTLWTWGNASNGRLGNTITSGSRSTPITTFAGGTDWKQVSSGSSHTTAIKTDGTLWTWGLGTSGQLGNNILSNRSTPVTTFAGGTNWKQVSAGNAFTAAIKTDGTLWVCGFNSEGQLGTTDVTSRSTPVTIFSGGNDWKQVSCGNGHIGAIKSNGTLWTWGGGSFGRLGNANITDRSTPVTTFAGGTNWRQVNSSYRYVTAIKTDGTLWVWGYNNTGELGINDTTNRSTPVTVFSGGTNWKQVDAGYGHTSAIKSDGTLWIWGSGSKGELGDDNIADTLTPVTTSLGGTNWKQSSTGDNYTIAIQSRDYDLSDLF